MSQTDLEAAEKQGQYDGREEAEYDNWGEGSGGLQEGIRATVENDQGHCDRDVLGEIDVSEGNFLDYVEEVLKWLARFVARDNIRISGST